MAERDTYHYIWQDFQPVSIQDQVKYAEHLLCMKQNYLSKQVALNKMHPSYSAAEMKRMRSILYTLKQLAATESANPAINHNPVSPEKVTEAVA